MDTRASGKKPNKEGRRYSQEKTTNKPKNNPPLKNPQNNAAEGVGVRDPPAGGVNGELGNRAVSEKEGDGQPPWGGDSWKTGVEVAIVLGSVLVGGLRLRGSSHVNDMKHEERAWVGAKGADRNAATGSGGLWRRGRGPPGDATGEWGAAAGNGCLWKPGLGPY